jgi:hypothetical protein
MHELGSLGLVGVVTGAGADAELGLELALEGSGVDEADQVLGEGRFLRPGCQPDRLWGSRTLLSVLTWASMRPARTR